MAIIYDQDLKVFHLKTRGTSYVMNVYNEKYLAHLYYGRRLETNKIDYVLRFEDRAHIMNDNPDERYFSPETLPQEYPAFGAGDLKNPAYQIRDGQGNYISDAQYVSHRIYAGKELLQGLPATYAVEKDAVETLEIVMSDPLLSIRIILTFSVFEDYDTITRNVRIENFGGHAIHLLKAMSMNIDFTNKQFDMIHLNGSWARECAVERVALCRGRIELESLRGISSSLHNPFFALADKDATEDIGEVYGFSLVYSGNHLIQVEVDQYDGIRAALGVNPTNFDWKLEPGTVFQTPECVMVYSENGIGGMSRLFHTLYRERLCRSKYANQPRPIQLNSWETFYFDFTEETLLSLAEDGRKLGIELFVLDDGWFGKRNNDKCSLGDWYVNRDKIPSGLDCLAEKINALDMLFGIWLEPEMISPDSDLFREHPDWRLHVPGRAGHQSRNQFVLDLSRDDVCEWMIAAVSRVLECGRIAHVKWDMNRQLSEVGSAAFPAGQQGEIYHRYVLGLYRCVDTLTAAFPDVLFESCAGGGGRFDPGMLHYMPQIWASDDTDAIERLSIQYGYSMVYPWSCLSSHYSVVPNHQLNRVTPSKTRANAAMTGSFGYELDLRKLSEDERNEIIAINSQYKEDRTLLVTGDFYRLISPIGHEQAAWMIVSKDRRQAVVYYFGILMHPNQPFKWLKLKGLDLDKQYWVEELAQSFSGTELTYIGVPIPNFKQDYQSVCFHLEAVKAEGEK